MTEDEIDKYIEDQKKEPLFDTQVFFTIAVAFCFESKYNTCDDTEETPWTGKSGIISCIRKDLNIDRGTSNGRISAVMKDLLTAKEAGVRFDPQEGVRRKGRSGRKSSIDINSQEAQIIADAIESGMSIVTAWILVNTHREVEELPSLTVTAIRTCIKKLQPAKAKIKNEKQGSLDPNAPTAKARFGWCLQLALRLNLMSVQDVKKHLRKQKGTERFNENLLSCYDPAKLTKLSIDQFVTWDEVHKKVMPGSDGDGYVKSPYKDHILKFPRDKNGEMDPVNGSYSKEKVTMMKCKYTDKVCLCLGVAVVTPVIDIVEQPMEGRRCRPFVYSGQTLLSLTDYEKKIQTEIDRVRNLKGGDKSGWVIVKDGTGDKIYEDDPITNLNKFITQPPSSRSEAKMIFFCIAHSTTDKFKIAQRKNGTTKILPKSDNMSAHHTTPNNANVIVDAVVRHWRHVCSPRECEELPLFYANDGMILGPDPIRLQRGLDVITEGFASVGLKMNALKTKFMVMTGGKDRYRISTAAYQRLVTGAGPSWDQQRKAKVTCVKCGVEVGKANLKWHQLSVRCRKGVLAYNPPMPVREQALEQVITPIGEPAHYSLSIPPGFQGRVGCPVEGCPYVVKADSTNKRGQMRNHFRTRHFKDTIVIEEEGRLPQCRLCGIFMRDANSAKHQQSTGCKYHAEKPKQYFQAKRQSKATSVKFCINDVEIDQVNEFRYLGQILEKSDDDTPAALHQLQQARAKWGRFNRILRSEGADPKSMGYFYKAIIQAILLYGSESWTVPEFVLRQFRSFHSRVARYLTKRHIQQLPDGTWNCPATEEVLEEAGLFPIDEYIQRRWSTVYQFAVERPLYDACRQSSPLVSNVKKTVWWRLP